MNLIEITSQIHLLETFKLTKNESNILIIPYTFINNLGLDLLKTLIMQYNVNHIPCVINCENTLAYTIYAIEIKFPYILFYHKNKIILNNMKVLAQQENVTIFTNNKNMFEYFRKNHYNK
ncbi:hypothetical protein HAV_00804 [Candidatus Hepatincola sp. Av]